MYKEWISVSPEKNLASRVQKLVLETCRMHSASLAHSLSIVVRVDWEA
jgi:hypothetical protein